MPPNVGYVAMPAPRFCVGCSVFLDPIIRPAFRLQKQKNWKKNSTAVLGVFRLSALNFVNFRRLTQLFAVTCCVQRSHML